MNEWQDLENGNMAPEDLDREKLLEYVYYLDAKKTELEEIIRELEEDLAYYERKEDEQIIRQAMANNKTSHEEGRI